jgi:SBF-like CPA transporter family (DUF4137)
VRRTAAAPHARRDRVRFARQVLQEDASGDIVLSILWNAFCKAFSGDIGLAWSQLATLSILLPLLHYVAFEAVFQLLARPRLRLSRKDVVAGSFCTGQTTFQGSPSLVSNCAPIILIHSIQLVVGTFLLPRLRRYTSSESEISAASMSFE